MLSGLLWYLGIEGIVGLGGGGGEGGTIIKSPLGDVCPHCASANTC